MKTAARSTFSGMSRRAGLSDPAGRRSRLIEIAFLYLGINAAIPQTTVVNVGPITLGLIVAGGLAAIGWRSLDVVPEVRRYMLWASFLGSWVLISAVATWSTDTLYDAAVYAIWPAVLVPGIAPLMGQTSYRHAFLTGWFLGASRYALTAAFRLAAGKELFDLEGTFVTQHLLGEIRGSVNSTVLVILPFLLTKDGGRLMRFFRWPIAALIALWVVQSGSRAGILALAAVLLVLAVVQPGLTRFTQRLSIALLVGCVSFLMMEASGGRFTESTDRLSTFISGEKTESDRARELLLRKSWHLTMENPAFGVGIDRFVDTYHPVIEEAETLHEKEIALEFEEHNAFAAIMAETGFPGLVAFVGIFVAALVAGFRTRWHRGSRAATAAMAGLTLSIGFHNADGPRLFLPFALLLASVVAARLERADTPAVLDDGT